MPIYGNMVGAYSQIGKTFVIIDESGNELTGVVTEKEQIFTATDNDVRENAVYAGDSGVSTGTKVIPAYHTHQGFRAVTAGSNMTIPNIDPKINSYDYTKLQAIICAFNTSLSDSVAAEHVCIDDNVYPVQSVASTSVISRDHNSKIINLGITNNSQTMKIIRYFMYKELYGNGE